MQTTIWFPDRVRLLMWRAAVEGLERLLPYRRAVALALRGLALAGCGLAAFLVGRAVGFLLLRLLA